MRRRGTAEQTASPENHRNLGSRKLAIGKHGAPAENKGNMQSEANMQTAFDKPSAEEQTTGKAIRDSPRKYRVAVKAK